MRGWKSSGFYHVKHHILADVGWIACHSSKLDVAVTKEIVSVIKIGIV